MTRHVYLHIPFCRTICTYCDFTKWLYQEAYCQQYLDALAEEVRTRYQQEEVTTIYIGGGTPSALSLAELKKLEAILLSFHKAATCEVTIECNPEDVTDEKLKQFRAMGINRLSLGIETGNPRFTSFLGRKVLSKKEWHEKLEQIRKWGFENVSGDLMYALENETKEEVQEDLSLLLSLNLDHISTYALQIEEHTVLYSRKTEPLLEEEDALLYDVICDTLKRNGYVHYEVSNFAKPGKESRHNLAYWKNETYYGFGLGASGYEKNIRYQNTKSMSHYLRGSWCKEKEKLALKDEAYYQVILGLRTKEGIDKDNFEKRFHHSIIEWFPAIEKLVAKGYLIETATHFLVDEKYQYVLSSILVEI